MRSWLRFNATKYKNNTEKILTWLHTMFIVVTFVLTGLAVSSRVNRACYISVLILSKVSCGSGSCYDFESQG